MELREIIEVATEKQGSVRNLAKVIGVSDSNLTAAKAGRRGLPDDACGKLADLIGVDRWKVLAASNLVTEKNEEKRAYWLPFVLNGMAAAATVSIALLGTLVPTDAQAKVDTFKVSSPASKPAPLTGFASGAIRIMSNTVSRWLNRINGLVRSSCAAAFRHSCCLCS